MLMKWFLASTLLYRMPFQLSVADSDSQPGCREEVSGVAQNIKFTALLGFYYLCCPKLSIKPAESATTY